MRYYILDDDIAMTDALEDIILDKGLGDIAGTETDPLIAIDEIIRTNPDIVLVDFMMSGMDGIKLVEKVKERRPDVSFVMISKVSDKSIVQKAYNAGVEFFISKPVSIVEIERVLGNVSERIKMRTMMNSIRSMFDNSHIVQPVYTGTAEHSRREVPKGMDCRNIDILLGEIGILGESGVKDIRLICSYAAENDRVYDKLILEKVAEEEGDNVRNVEQRVRRAIRKGISNAAKAGLEDIGSDKFTVYANYVYDYSALRDEMNYLSKGTGSGGRISISRFIEGLLLYNNNI